MVASMLGYERLHFKKNHVGFYLKNYWTITWLVFKFILHAESKYDTEICIF